MKARERLNELIQFAEDSTTSEKFVSLTNPKNVALMEVLVAWTCIPVQFDDNIEVKEDSSMLDMWDYTDANIKELADTTGLSIQETMVKIKQLKNLGMIFPDGTAHSKALSIIRVYVKGKVEKL